MKVISFLKDREYYRHLIRLTLPLAMQNLVTASLNMVALVLIGQLGEDSVAAVGLANQIWFLLNLFIFGIVSGSSIFIAQLWGKNDVQNIRKVIGFSTKLSVFVALFFWAVSIFFPKAALHIYSNDPQVMLIGSRYLVLFGWSYLFYAISSVYYAALRSTGNVRMPMVVGISALGLNILLTYLLVFGVSVVGIPAMGVEGAALAGLISRILECLAIVVMVYKDRNNPVAAGLRDIFSFDFKFMLAVMKPVLPVILNEIFWSLAVTTYNIIYGHIGTIAVAAVNIIGTVEQLAFVLFQGVGTATAIMVGNQIGRGDEKKAFQYAGRSIILQVLSSMMMGVLVYYGAGLIFELYKVDAQVIAYAYKLLIVLSCGLCIKAANHTLIIGIFRSGGDTRFSLVLDGLIIWVVGVPALAAGAFLFDLPIYFVYLLTYCEEVTKLIIGFKRYFSKKWIHDLTEKVEVLPLSD